MTPGCRGVWQHSTEAARLLRWRSHGLQPLSTSTPLTCLRGSAHSMPPQMLQVRDFQAVIGRETRQQCLEKLGRDPDVLLACVGGGSNAIGLFHEFVDDAHVRLIGEPGLPAGQACAGKAPWQSSATHNSASCCAGRHC